MLPKFDGVSSWLNRPLYQAGSFTFPREFSYTHSIKLNLPKTDPEEILENTRCINKNNITYIKCSRPIKKFPINELDDIILSKIFGFTVIYHYGIDLTNIKLVCNRWNKICKNNLPNHLLTESQLCASSYYQYSYSNISDIEFIDLYQLGFQESSNIGNDKLDKILAEPYHLIIYKGLRFFRSYYLTNDGYFGSEIKNKYLACSHHRQLENKKKSQIKKEKLKKTPEYQIRLKNSQKDIDEILKDLGTRDNNKKSYKKIETIIRIGTIIRLENNNRVIIITIKMRIR